jgi:hypothetical protein
MQFNNITGSAKCGKNSAPWARPCEPTDKELLLSICSAPPASFQAPPIKVNFLAAQIRVIAITDVKARRVSGILSKAICAEG